jgi:hypothetical protein
VHFASAAPSGKCPIFLLECVERITDMGDDSGVGQAYWQVILGRVATGCGASGIISLASIIITGEMIPHRFW